VGKWLGKCSGDDLRLSLVVSRGTDAGTNAEITKKVG
jgi:hypothetical protein